MENVYAVLNSLETYTKFPAIDNSTKEKVRCLKEPPQEKGGECTYFVYDKGRSRYGSRYSKEIFAKWYTPAIPTAEEENMKWHKRIRRVLKEIDRTGLWKGSTMETVFRNLLLVDIEDRKEIRRIFWDAHYENGKRIFDEKAMQPFMEKYPFMFLRSAEDVLTANVDTDYIFELSDCKLKSTYFGVSNAYEKERIRSAIAEKRKIAVRAYTSYDVSFDTDFERQDGIPRAWYSEEYKGCGNGYYYYAVSENCAVFIEKD